MGLGLSGRKAQYDIMVRMDGIDLFEWIITAQKKFRKVPVMPF